MKNLKELNGTTVKAKYFGKEIDCIISIDDNYLYLCHDTMPDGLDEAYYERAKVFAEYEKTYKTTYKSGLSQDWELMDEELGIYVFGKAEKINLNVEEANFIKAVCANTFTAPALKKIYGSLMLGFSPDAKIVDCPQLECIGGILNITSTQAITFPNLKTLKGNLYAEYASALNMPAFEVVEGDIFAKAAETINMPMLKAVDYFKAKSAKIISLPNLKAANRVFANTATEVNLPMLETVSDFEARSAKIINLPNLKAANRVFANSAIKLNMPNIAKGIRRLLYRKLDGVGYQRRCGYNVVDLPKALDC